MGKPLTTRRGRVRAWSTPRQRLANVRVRSDNVAAPWRRVLQGWSCKMMMMDAQAVFNDVRVASLLMGNSARPRDVLRTHASLMQCALIERVGSLDLFN